MTMDSMITLINTAKENGFTQDFIVKDEQLLDIQTKKTYSADDIIVVKNERFEALSAAEDSSVITYIECKNDNAKGTTINAHGPTSDITIDHFLNQAEYKTN